jgi:FAD/FMN-containing dehydrogenase/Fe-S oxidoreductase
LTRHVRASEGSIVATPRPIRPEHLITDIRRREVGAEHLEAALRRVVSGEVRFDAGSRALYATDGSNYRQPPIGVVIPRTTDDVVAAVAVCRAHGAPIFGRGCGTSLAGQCCNAAVCFDFSKYLNQVLAIDPDQRLARVQPGTILDDLRGAAMQYGLTFGPDPSTHDHCTLGGMIGNNSCGVHSVMAQFFGPGPRTSDNVEALDVLTYGGVRMHVDAGLGRDEGRWQELPPAAADILRRLQVLARTHEQDIRDGMPDIPRRVSGYNLTALLPEHGFNVAHALVGSESTCVLVLEATVRLIPNPPSRSLVVLGYPSIFEAADHVPEIMAHQPIGCEGMDDRLVKDIEAVGFEADVLRLLPEGAGFLLLEFGGDSKEEADRHANQAMAAVAARPHPPAMKLFDDPREEKKVWRVREAGLGATAHVDRHRPTWEGWEDAAVPPDRLGEYLRAFRHLLDKHHLEGDLYGHFGQGCVHTRINFDLQTAAGIAGYRAFVEDAADLVVRCGGSLSGEHGDGQSRGELLSKMYGPALMTAFHEFKRVWDPGWKMNPGKIIDPYPLDSNLRLGPHYAPPPLTTHFHYRNESGGFAKATLRCVGVGECRRLDGGTMCPSFKVTREEKHSTRGRAHLLFEMLQGDPLRDGWRNEAVKDALDLCLACKGCKSDCPVSVDMATYKAEFLAHYYEHHRRPITAYAFGWIYYWARLASYMPRVVNVFTQTPGLRGLAKLLAGMPQQRDIPAFAPFTFRQWFARQPAQLPAGRPRVILWPDTFNNHFHPETAIAATRVLQRAGYQVDLPAQPLCCGRPLFDYGMVDRARGWLRGVIDALAPEIEAGVPVVGLEPSCAAVFRDELMELFPDDHNASRLAQQTYLLSEFLEKSGTRYPRLHRHALVHGHCHHKAVMKMDAEESVLRGAGLDYELLDSGCCGLAGSFGFERPHYDVSMQVGELVLLPAVRAARRDTLIVADGFSCRTQIAHATPRRALHLAEVLDMAATDGPAGPAGDYPERTYVPDYRNAVAMQPRTVALIAGACVATLAAWLLARRRRQRSAAALPVFRDAPSPTCS